MNLSPISLFRSLAAAWRLAFETWQAGSLVLKPARLHFGSLFGGHGYFMSLQQALRHLSLGQLCFCAYL